MRHRRAIQRCTTPFSRLCGSCYCVPSPAAGPTRVPRLMPLLYCCAVGTASLLSPGLSHLPLHRLLNCTYRGESVVNCYFSPATARAGRFLGFSAFSSLDRKNTSQLLPESLVPPQEISSAPDRRITRSDLAPVSWYRDQDLHLVAGVELPKDVDDVRPDGSGRQSRARRW